MNTKATLPDPMIQVTYRSKILKVIFVIHVLFKITLTKTME